MPVPPGTRFHFALAGTAVEAAYVAGRYTAIIRPLLAFPIIIYFWKVIVWDNCWDWERPTRSPA